MQEKRIGSEEKREKQKDKDGERIRSQEERRRKFSWRTKRREKGKKVDRNEEDAWVVMFDD